MFHGVGNVNAFPIDPDFEERTVEDLAGRADKWTAFSVFGIAGLFTDKDNRGVPRAFAEDGLCRIFVERASGATGSRVA